MRLRESEMLRRNLIMPFENALAVAGIVSLFAGFGLVVAIVDVLESRHRKRNGG